MYLEIELAHKNFFAAHQSVHIGGETLHVDAFDMLVIELSVLVARITFVANEIIVGRH